MNLSSACIAESTLQAKLLSATRAMLRKCISSDRVLLKFSTMKMMRLKKRNQSCTCQNTLTLETIKFCTTWNLTWFSKHLLIHLIQLVHQNNFQISFSCASQKLFYVTFAIYSHKQLKISSEDLWKEDIDSCSKRTPILELLKRKRMRKIARSKAQPHKINLNMVKMQALKMKTSLKISTVMKNQKTSRVRKKIWRCILTS